MTPDFIEDIAQNFDDVFFLIGAAILGIELLKTLFSKPFKSHTLLDMVASVSTQIPLSFG